MTRHDRTFLSFGVASALLYLAAVIADLAALRLYSKAVPVLLLATWLWSRRERDARLVVAGLLLSAVGDLCLEVSPQIFSGGLLAFLIAHIAYATAFIRRTRKPALTVALPIVATAILFFLWLRPHLGSMTFPVLLYVGVISVMVWRAWAQVVDSSLDRRVAWFAALGATSFFLSDMLVAYNSFLTPLLGLKLLLMPLYWAGQWGIAASVAADETGRPT